MRSGKAQIEMRLHLMYTSFLEGWKTEAVRECFKRLQFKRFGTENHVTYGDYAEGL